MDTTVLKKFAQAARRALLEQVTARLNQVLREGSAARREQTQAVAELEKQIRQTNKTQVIERVAYLWFNRFCALRLSYSSQRKWFTEPSRKVRKRPFSGSACCIP